MDRHFKNILLLFPNDTQVFSIYEKFFKKQFADIYTVKYMEYFYEYGLLLTEKHIKNLIRKKSIDMIMVFFAGFHLSIDFFNNIKGRRKIVFWFFDDEQYLHTINKYYAQIADVVVTTDYYSLSAYEQLGIPAIFNAFSINAFHAGNHSPIFLGKNIDVSFVGYCKKNDREDYLDYLIRHGIDVKTFGEGSNNGFIEQNKIPEVFLMSKINLNFTKLDETSWLNHDEPLVNRIKGFKGRPIEIAIAKSFCLSEYSPAIERLFSPGLEIEFFYSKEELLEKVKYYLKHEEEREEIAIRANKKAIENYEANTCAERVLNEILILLDKDNPKKINSADIYLSAAFKIKNVIRITLYMGRMIKNKKYKLFFELIPYLFQYGLWFFLIGFGRGFKIALKNYLK